MKINISGNYFKRWEVLTINSTGTRAIITGKLIRDGMVTLNVSQYSPSKYWIIRVLQFWWLKLKVHYS